MRGRSILFAGLAMLAGCSEKAEQNSTAKAVENAAAPQHPSFCFFKPEETKGWTAKRGADGNVAVTGKAHVKDSRYQASLGSPEVSGTSAKLWVSINPNSGAYGAADDWWDVSATLPASSGVTQISVMCGPKPVAQIEVPAAASR